MILRLLRRCAAATIFAEDGTPRRQLPLMLPARRYAEFFFLFKRSLFICRFDDTLITRHAIATILAFATAPRLIFDALLLTMPFTPLRRRRLMSRRRLLDVDCLYFTCLPLRCALCC